MSLSKFKPKLLNHLVLLKSGLSSIKWIISSRLVSQ